MERLTCIAGMFSTLLMACSSQNVVSGKSCSRVNSVVKQETLSTLSSDSLGGGLLLMTHLDEESELNLQEPMATKEKMTQCNVALELLDASKVKVRMWTASHCIRPLLLTKLTLAVRDRLSESGRFFKWDVSHRVLADAKKMRKAYDYFSGSSLVGARVRLWNSFDRRKMIVEGSNAVLTPRVSCENLRWSQAADGRHSLCFSIFDLMHIDFELPDKDSAKTLQLIDELKKNAPVSSTADRIALKRETFLRRMHTTSQAEWIIHEGNRVRQFMSSFPRASFPYFSNDIYEIEKLNREVFSLPHPEEWNFMDPQTFVTQDASPPNLNSSYTAINAGTYTSPRTTIEGVAVTCHRQLRKYNPETDKVEVLPELEVRPHEYCPGGSSFQADHFWNRDRPWSKMIADMTVEAAQQYSAELLSLLNESQSQADQLTRLTISSTFGITNDLGFENRLADLTTQLLRHLRIPAAQVSNEIVGINDLALSGAFLFSLPISDTKARFLKGDSGSIVLLDGVPIATLYSVDGEETSGGAAVLPLPTIAEDGAWEDQWDDPIQTVKRSPLDSFEAEQPVDEAVKTARSDSINSSECI